MANKKITQLVNKTSILSTDLFPIGDATTGQLYKKTVAELQAAIGGAVISVNGKVGTVVLTTDDVAEAVSPTNLYFSNTRARGAVSATSPLVFNSSTGVFSMPAATTSVSGHLSSTDWTTFNGKENVLTFSGPLVRSTNTISIPVATTSVNGYLSSTDWTTFNNKQGALTLTVTGSSGASTLVGTTLNIPTYTLGGLGGITASFLSGGTGITYNSGTGVIATTITQYTDALARASLSFTAGSGAYNSTTGVITIPTNTSQLTNGAAFITLTSLSGSTGISYNNTTGAISSTITQYTDALARGAISLTVTGSSGASTYNSTTGVLNVPTYTLSGLGGQPVLSGTGFVKISGTTISYDNSTYLTTASAASTYQTIITNPVTGTGTTNYIPKWTSSSALGNSLIYDNGTNVGINTTSSGALLEIYDTGSGNIFNLKKVSSSTQASIDFYRAKAGTTIVADGDNLGRINAWGYDGIGYNSLGASIDFTVTGTPATNSIPGSIIFKTNPSGGQYSTERMRLTSSGGLAIGSTSLPTSSKLHIAGYVSIPNNLGYCAVNTSGTISQIIGLNSSDKTIIGTTTDGSVITLSGSSVGIGTSSPSSKLTIQGLTSDQIRVYEATDSSNYYKIGRNSSTGYLDFYGNQNGYVGYLFGGIDGTRMTLNSSGNLGLGVTPSAWASGFKAMQMTGGVAIASHPSLPIMYLGANYLASDTGAKYIQSDGAARLLVNGYSGGFQWDIAPSGTAGNTITFTQAMTLASTGNLLVGTTTDSGYKLDVNGTGRFSSSVTANATVGVTNTSATQAGFKADYTGTGALQVTFSTYNDTMNIYNETNAYSIINFTRSTKNLVINPTGGSVSIGKNTSTFGTSTRTSLELNGSTDSIIAWYGGGSSSGYIFGNGTTSMEWATTGYAIISTGGSERMRITSGGLVGVGTSSPNNYGSTTLTIASTSGVNNGALIVRNSTDGLRGHIYSDGANGLITIGSATNHSVSFVSYDTERGRITNGGNWLLGTTTDNGEKLYISGNVRATGTITANSDIRLKKNLERIENALEKVGQISGYTYDTIYDDKRHGGVIAQEIDEVFPEIVNKGNDGLLGVEYGNISALLIEALKELKEKNTALEARLQALEK